MAEDVIVQLTPWLIGFGAGAASGFIQFWTKLKDENNDQVVDWKDFNPLIFGKTVVVSGVAGAYLAGTGLELDVPTLAILSVGVEKVVAMVIAAISQGVFNRNTLLEVPKKK